MLLKSIIWLFSCNIENYGYIETYNLHRVCISMSTYFIGMFYNNFEIFIENPRRKKYMRILAPVMYILCYTELRYQNLFAKKKYLLFRSNSSSILRVAIRVESSCLMVEILLFTIFIPEHEKVTFITLFYIKQ